jgi:hypothetical protein
METERLEYKLVMDDGPDTEVLGQVAHLEIGAAAFMAAVAKFPNRNIQLRHGRADHQAARWRAEADAGGADLHQSEKLRLGQGDNALYMLQSVM